MTEAAASSTAATSHQLSLPSPSTAGFMVAGVILVFVLFILFILFLLLYLRTNGYWGAIPSSNPLARQAPGQEPCGGLDPAALPPHVLLRAGDLKEGLECPVCLCELAEGDAIRLLSACGHAFHLECIDPWFCAHSACPLCRAPLAHKIPEIQDSAVELPPADSNSPEGSSNSSIELTIEVRAGDVLPEEATPTTVRSWLRVLGRGSRLAGEFDLEQGRAPIPKAPASS